MSEDKKLKVVFAPGVLEQLEAENTPEELQEMLDAIQAQFADPTFVENSKPVDMDALFLEDPELYFKLQSQIEKFNSEEFSQPTLH